MGKLMTDAVIQKGKMYAKTAPTLNISYGGPMRYIPVIGTKINGVTYQEWIANTPYVRMNVIPILLDYPKFFDLMPNTDQWIMILKSFMETQPTSIDGLNSTIELEFDESPVTRSEVLEEVTNSTRSRSNITYNLKEKANRANQMFLDIWIRYGIMDPDTGSALVTNYINNIDDVGGMYLPNFKGCTMMYIEPDFLRKQVINAWFCTNMQPKTTGDITGKADPKSGFEAPDLSIGFTSITINNRATIEYAQGLLEKLTIFNQLPDLDLLPTDDKINNEVASHGNGYNRPNQR